MGAAKILEIKFRFEEAGVLFDEVKNVLVQCCRDKLLSLQTAKEPHTMRENPLFKAGYQGYTMLAKDGKGMTVKYEQVGTLASTLHTRLLPLMNGPFGGAGQPQYKALSAIRLQMGDGPLDIESFETIGAFVAAIDQLPNPEPPEAPVAADGAPSAQELKKAIVSLYNERDQLVKTIKLLADRVEQLENWRVSMEVFSRSVPAA